MARAPRAETVTPVAFRTSCGKMAGLRAAIESLTHPMAIFITIMGTHGHFRYTLVRAYVCIFLSSTELTDDEKLQNTIRKHLKLLYN